MGAVIASAAGTVAFRTVEFRHRNPGHHHHCQQAQPPYGPSRPATSAAHDLPPDVLVRTGTVCGEQEPSPINEAELTLRHDPARHYTEHPSVSAN